MNLLVYRKNPDPLHSSQVLKACEAVPAAMGGTELPWHPSAILRPCLCHSGRPSGLGPAEVSLYNHSESQ